MSIPAPVIYK